MVALCCTIHKLFFERSRAVPHGPGREPDWHIHNTRIAFWPRNLTAQLCIPCEVSVSHSGAVPLMTRCFEGTCRRHLDLEPLTGGLSLHIDVGNQFPGVTSRQIGILYSSSSFPQGLCIRRTKFKSRQATPCTRPLLYTNGVSWRMCPPPPASSLSLLTPHD